MNAILFFVFYTFYPSTYFNGNTDGAIYCLYEDMKDLKMNRFDKIEGVFSDSSQHGIIFE